MRDEKSTNGIKRKNTQKLKWNMESSCAPECAVLKPTNVPPAGMLARRPGQDRQYYDAPAQRQIAETQCGQPLLFPLKNNMRSTPPEPITGILIIREHSVCQRNTWLWDISVISAREPSRYRSAYRSASLPTLALLWTHRSYERSTGPEPEHTLQLHL